MHPLCHTSSEQLSGCNIFHLVKVQWITWYGWCWTFHSWQISSNNIHLYNLHIDEGAHPTFKKTVLNSWYSTCKFYLVIHFSTPRSIFMTEHCYVHGITIFYLKVFCFQWNSVLQHFFLLPLKGKSVQSYQCLNVLIVCDQQREINRLFSNHDLLSRAFGRKIGSLHFLCFQIFTMIFSEGDHITLDRLFVY